MIEEQIKSKSINKIKIATVIQNARRKAGLKQSELAELVEISEKHLSKIETAKNYPALDTFIRIIEELKLNLSDFGIHIVKNNTSKKEQLHSVITNSAEEQIDLYYDVINTLKNHNK